MPQHGRCHVTTYTHPFSKLSLILSLLLISHLYFYPFILLLHLPHHNLPINEEKAVKIVN